MTPPDTGSAPRVSVLFVCLGNICRSPLAEGVFRSLLNAEGLSDRFRVDSAGTGSWHVGETPDPRAVAVAKAHGVELSGRARQIVPEDLADFDWVVAMDRSNLRHLERSGGDRGKARLHLLREFDPDDDGLDVPDPYYGGAGGFDDAYAIVERSCRAFLAYVLEQAGIRP